jgi:hypothetical protein
VLGLTPGAIISGTIAAARPRSRRLIVLTSAALLGSTLWVSPAMAAATTRYVATTGSDTTDCSNSGSPCATIQYAIGQSAMGDTIEVAAGTYAENIDVTQSVTIEGAGQGATIVEPAVSNPDPCSGSSLCGTVTAASNVFVIDADDVRITALTVEGDNPTLSSGTTVGGADIDARNGIITDYYGGAQNGLEVDHVTVRDIFLRGIYAASGGTFDFHDDTVTNVQADPSSIAMFNYGGTGTFADNTVSWANDGISANHSSGTTFAGNTITDSQSGIHTDNAGDGGGSADVISGNTVVCPSSGYGVWVFVPYIAPIVRDNSISNCAVGLGAFGGAFSPSPTVTTQFSDNRVDGGGASGSIGAWVSTTTFYFGDSNVAVAFDHNTIVHNDTGVEVDETAGSGATATAPFHYNVIAGNATVGLTTNSVGSVDAANNWWGCSAGPADTSHCNGVSGNVNANPWLVDHVTIPTAPAPINSSITASVDLTYNSDGVQPASTVPDGTSVVISSTPSGMSGSGATTGGTAQVTIPTGSASNLYDVCAQVPGTYGTAEGCASVPVYDPSAGFVTGGGWINSPAGADALALSASGKATFAFVSKYQKGATIPSGNTQFVFQAGGLDFSSTSYQWLVVNQGGTNAQFKGTGTINGAGSYTFMIWATQGSPSTFRIQITDNNNGGATVYDNGTQQPISGGSIIVHK